MIHLRLFIDFFRVGLFTFGGGYAMLPLLERELIEKEKWLTNDELLEIITIAQMTPGTIAVNTATFVGKRQGGYLGAIAASLGVIMPSFIIITAIFFLAGKAFTNEIVQKAFMGAKAAVAGLILSSVYKMIKGGLKNGYQIGLMILALASLYGGLHPIYLILWGAFSGIVFFGVVPKFRNSSSH